MTDEEKPKEAPPQIPVPEMTEGTLVKLSIACRSDLPPVMLQQYGAAVQFMAQWCKIHESNEQMEGMEFDQVMNLFVENVSRCLIGDVEGTG